MEQDTIASNLVQTLRYNGYNVGTDWQNCIEAIAESLCSADCDISLIYKTVNQEVKQRHESAQKTVSYCEGAVYSAAKAIDKNQPKAASVILGLVQNKIAKHQELLYAAV